jgi:GNAT superfamily N-acetyltransferase
MPMTQSEIIVEQLTEYTQADAAGIGALMPELSSGFSGEPIEEALLREIIESPDRAQLVARKAGKIVAVATMNLIIGPGAGRISELEDFVTDPNEQKQGIGDMLWQEVVRWGSEKGATKLTFTSHPSRDKAHSFYLKRGCQVRETTVFVLPLDK